MPKIGFFTNKNFKTSYRSGANKNASKMRTKLGKLPGSYGPYANQTKTGMGVELFGDWEELRSILGISGSEYIYQDYSGDFKSLDITPWEELIVIACERAAKRAGDFIARMIKKGIKEGAPGGRTLTPLSTGTVALRQAKKKERGEKAKTWVGANTSGYIKGRKPLLRTGDLYRAITYRVLEKGNFFVGIPKGSKNREGEDLSIIGTVMERGMTLKVTEKIANWYAAQGVPLRDKTTHIIIPPRPFIQPVLQKYKTTILQIYKEELTTVLFKAKGLTSTQKNYYISSRTKLSKLGVKKFTNF